MQRSTAALAVSICALIFGMAYAQDALSLEQLWRRGLFDEVREAIAEGMATGGGSRAFLSEAARAAYESGDYALAGDLYERAAAELGLDPDAYREARRMQWRSLWIAGGGEAAAPWVVGARAEVGLMLSEASLAKSASRQLALELDYILESLLNQAHKPSPELIRDYPRSPITLEATWREAQQISALDDDKLRAERAREFLRAYPTSYWRHLAYRTWLYSAWRLRDHKQLVQAGGQYVKEYPSSPEAHGALSRYYLDADIEPEAGFAAAKRCLELYETALGTGGNEFAVEALDRQSRNEPEQHAWDIPGARARYLDYLGSRFNLARWHIKRSEFSEAHAQVLPVIAARPFTLDEELSLAPFYVAAGQAAVGKGDNDEAYRYYMGALVEGDASGRYALQAEQELSKLGSKLGQLEAQAIRESYLPAEMGRLSLPQFTDVTIAAGLEGQSCRRVAWGDINNDGHAELLLDGTRLMWNEPAKGFVETTRGVGLSGGYTGGIFADVDSDGDLDIFSFGDGMRGDKLWKNEAARFTDGTSLAGSLGDSQRNEAAVFTDIDGDGWIDLYLPVYDRSYDIGEIVPRRRMDSVFMNSGRGVFSKLSAEATGLQSDVPVPSTARGAAAADIDGDGSAEIYVANSLLAENLLWQYEGSAFSNIGRLLDAAGHSDDGRFGSSSGVDFAELNGDGILDMFVANTLENTDEPGSDRSMLLLSRETSFGFDYAEVRSQSGIKASGTACEPCFGDFNNDGHTDLLLTNSYGGRRCSLYLNNGRGQFVDVTFMAGLRAYDGWGCGVADFDRDGDLDIAIASPSGLRLLRNDSPAQSWLQVECRGQHGSVAAIGARITVESTGGRQIGIIQSGRGTGSGSELVAHFGLGSARGGGNVTVTFPGGRKASKRFGSVNDRIVVSFPEAGSAAQEDAPQESAEDDGRGADLLFPQIERPGDGSRE